MKFSTQIDKRWTVAIFHMLLWTIVFSLPHLLNVNYNNPYKNTPEGETRFFYLNSSVFLFWIVLFYLNSRILIPKFVYSKKYPVYALLLASAFITAVGSYYFLYHLFIIDQSITAEKALKHVAPYFFLSVAVSMVYRVRQDQIETDKLIQQTRQEKLRAQLSFLRSQINPHFVFNVLNNMVALVRMQSKELEATVMKLSSLMQYMMYEEEPEKISLETEAGYLQSYIDLQRQRFGKKVKIRTTINLSNTGDTIEPMLLIPFVENAFKHGTGLVGHPQIEINLQTKDHTLYFTVRNRYNETCREKQNDKSGIGLDNVSKRLNLLYADNHRLVIQRENHWFHVSLHLNLQP